MNVEEPNGHSCKTGCYPNSVARSQNRKRTDPALKPDKNQTMMPKFRGPRKKHRVQPNFQNQKDFEALKRTDGLKLRLESPPDAKHFLNIATYGLQNRHISATSTLFTRNFNIVASQKATGSGLQNRTMKTEHFL